MSFQRKAGACSQDALGFWQSREGDWRQGMCESADVEEVKRGTFSKGVFIAWFACAPQPSDTTESDNQNLWAALGK